MPPFPTHAGLTPEYSLCRKPWRCRGGLLSVEVGGFVLTVLGWFERERQARMVPGKSVLCSLFCVTYLATCTGAGGFQCPRGRGVTPPTALLPVGRQLLVDTCASSWCPPDCGGGWAELR